MVKLSSSEKTLVFYSFPLSFHILFSCPFSVTTTFNEKKIWEYLTTMVASAEEGGKKFLFLGQTLNTFLFYLSAEVEHTGIEHAVLQKCCAPSQNPTIS